MGEGREVPGQTTPAVPLFPTPAAWFCLFPGSARPIQGEDVLEQRAGQRALHGGSPSGAGGAQAGLQPCDALDWMPGAACSGRKARRRRHMAPPMPALASALERADCHARRAGNSSESAAPRGHAPCSRPAAAAAVAAVGSGTAAANSAAQPVTHPLLPPRCCRRCCCRVKSKNAGRPGLPRADAPYLLPRLQVRRCTSLAWSSSPCLLAFVLQYSTRGMACMALCSRASQHTDLLQCTAAAVLFGCSMPTLPLLPCPSLCLLLWRRQKGFISLSTYLTTYKLGDYVDIKVNGAVHKVRLAHGLRRQQDAAAAALGAQGRRWRASAFGDAGASSSVAAGCCCSWRSG